VRPQDGHGQDAVVTALQNGIAGASETKPIAGQPRLKNKGAQHRRWRRQTGRGNDGAVESPEKQKQLSRPFHRPLEISLRRDSHIPTARLRPGWKSAKPKTGFSLSHAWLATITPVRSFKKQTTKKGSRPLRGLVILNFQDHLVLETQPAFRIILGLENAQAILTEGIVVHDVKGEETADFAERVSG
jgi:hypothetical protein